MKKFLSIYNQDQVLSKLISISHEYTGIIRYSDDFEKYFPKMPLDALFKILHILAECEFIDIDYFDYKNHTFSEIHILSAGYNHLPRKRSDNWRFYIPLIISVASLVTAVATLIISVIALR